MPTETLRWDGQQPITALIHFPPSVQIKMAKRLTDRYSEYITHTRTHTDTYTQSDIKVQLKRLAECYLGSEASEPLTASNLLTASEPLTESINFGGTLGSALGFHSAVGMGHLRG